MDFTLDFTIINERKSKTRIRGGSGGEQVIRLMVGYAHCSVVNKMTNEGGGGGGGCKLSLSVQKARQNIHPI